MAVQAVLARVQLSADKPLRERRLPVQHARPLFLPGQCGRFFRPKLFRRLDRLRMKFFVGGGIREQRLFCELPRGFENALFDQVGLDAGGCGAFGHRGWKWGNLGTKPPPLQSAFLIPVKMLSGERTRLACSEWRPAIHSLGISGRSGRRVADLHTRVACAPQNSAMSPRPTVQRSHASGRNNTGQDPTRPRAESGGRGTGYSRPCPRAA